MKVCPSCLKIKDGARFSIIGRQWGSTHFLGRHALSRHYYLESVDHWMGDNGWVKDMVASSGHDGWRFYIAFLKAGSDSRVFWQQAEDSKKPDESGVRGFFVAGWKLLVLCLQVSIKGLSCLDQDYHCQLSQICCGAGFLQVCKLLEKKKLKNKPRVEKKITLFPSPQLGHSL